MELALRRAYGFAYGPKIRKRAGFGMGFLGDDTTLDDSGDGTVSVQDTGGTDTTTLAIGGGYAGASVEPTGSGYAVQTQTAADLAALQASGASCSATGDCVLTPTQAASVIAGSSSVSPALLNSLATAAAAVARAINTPAGSINCGNGSVAAPGTPCAGAPTGSICPTGYTLSGTTCMGSVIPGLSNSSLVLIGIAMVALMAFSGKR